VQWEIEKKENMKVNKCTTAILLTLLFVSIVTAQSIPEKIDELVSTYYDYDMFSGTVLIAAGDSVIYHGNYGYADFRTKERIGRNSQFRIASVSKQFTAMGIMVLKERGLLDFDDDMRKYLPELPYEGMTIRQFMTHTSGFPNSNPLSDKYWDVENIGSPERAVLTNDDVYDLLVKYKPDVKFQPGEMHKYCNDGYMMLSLIIERITGEEFHTFMEENVFKPIGMNHTLFQSPLLNQNMPYRVRGYKMSPDGTEYILNDYHWMNGIEGAGGMFTTAEDLFRWDQTLYTDKLVSQTTIVEAFTPVTLNDGSTHDYGLGWSIIGGGKVVAHGGSWLGFKAFIWREIEAKNTVIVLCNNTIAPRFEIGEKISDIIKGNDYKLPRKSLAAELKMLIFREGVEKAIPFCLNMRSENPQKYNTSERELNALGYEFLNKEKVAEALAIFKLNVSEFPESWNVYDSLGEGYMVNGDRDLSIKFFRKSLEMNPENANAESMLKRLKVE